MCQRMLNALNNILISSFNCFSLGTLTEIHGNSPRSSPAKLIEMNCADFCSFRGLYFIMVMQLDLNVTNPARTLYDLKALIQNSCWSYLRTVVHFQLPNEVLLNSTAFSFQVSEKHC